MCVPRALCPEEGIGYLEFTDCCELPCGCSESNLGLLEEQPVLLMVEPSLQISTRLTDTVQESAVDYKLFQLALSPGLDETVAWTSPADTIAPLSTAGSVSQMLLMNAHCLKPLPAFDFSGK